MGHTANYKVVFSISGANPNHKPFFPFSTALGCQSTLTITGSGFASLRDSVLLFCVFEGVGATPATVHDDNTLHCDSVVQNQVRHTYIYILT